MIFPLPDNPENNLQHLSETPDNHLLLDEDRFLRKVFESDSRLGCEVLFKKYFSQLCSHAIRFVYSREVAEDIVAEIFCHLWNEQVFNQITGSYRAYLFKAVRYRAYNYVKWEMSRRSEKEVFDMEFALPEMTPDEVLQFDELTQKIEATIAELPPQCRNVFLMSRFETKKNKDIAQNLGISIKAVEAHVSKALHMLRIALKEN